MSRRANSRPKPEILIAGAGPSGLTLALALADAQIPCLVANRDAAPVAGAADRDGRAYSIALGCWNIWAALGVADLLAKDAQPIEKVTAEAAGGRPIIFSQEDLDAATGPLGYMIEARRLNLALRRKAEDSPLITIAEECAVADLKVDAGCAHVMLTDRAEPVECRLVVGCDGRGSTVRRLSGVRWFGHDYETSSLVATVKLERPHQNTARQTFLKSGPFAVLPLTQDRANIVWTVPHDVAKALCAMSDRDFAAEMAARAGDFIGGFSVDGPRLHYPLILRVAEHFYAERVALVADAAHAIHPLAGQGLNLGLKDVAAFAETLVEADRAGLDLGAPMALETYDALRRKDVLSMAYGMDGFEKLFSAPSPLRAIAGLGMGIIGDMERARGEFARHASALSDGASRLMRGQRFSG